MAAGVVLEFLQDVRLQSMVDDVIHEPKKRFIAVEQDPPALVGCFDHGFSDPCDGCRMPAGLILDTPDGL